MIGKADLAYHMLDGRHFAGPGWCGVPRTDVDDDVVVSIWDNRAFAHDLHLDREKGATGTSILVVGFYDASSEKREDIEAIADDIEKAAAANFWPALVSGRLGIRITTQSGLSIKRRVDVDPEKYQPEFVEAYRKFKSGEAVADLRDAGDVTSRQAILRIPGRTADPKHAPVDHETVVVVRRDSSDTSPDNSNRVVYFRGQEMVIMSRQLRNIVFGAMPFRAMVLCGMASTQDEQSQFGEQFLRASEPPAHNRWELTPELKDDYQHGSGARLHEFQQEVQRTILELIKSTQPDLDDGPSSLKQLLRIGPPPESTMKPRVEIDQEESRLDQSGAWVLRCRVLLPDRRAWSMTPVLRFAAESGAGKVVQWEIRGIQNCKVEDGILMVPSGAREAEFEGVSDPASHPAPSTDTAVSVQLRAVHAKQESST